MTLREEFDTAIGEARESTDRLFQIAVETTRENGALHRRTRFLYGIITVLAALLLVTWCSWAYVSLT